jgi:hypothetical protein
MSNTSKSGPLSPDRPAVDRDRILTALNSTCESDTAWEDAQNSADAVIEAAYDEYVDSLEQMGIKPKNVC